MANEVTIRVGADTSSADKAIKKLEKDGKASFVALSAAASAVGNVAANAITKGLELAAEGVKKLGEATLELVKAANTPELQRVKNTWEQLRQSFLDSTRESAALAGGLDAVSGALQDITRWASSAEGRQAIDGYFRAIASGAALAVRGVDAVVRTLRFTRQSLRDLLTQDAQNFQWGEFPSQDSTVSDLIGRLDDAGTGQFRMTATSNTPFFQLGGSPETQKQSGPSEQDALMADALRIARENAKRYDAWTRWRIELEVEADAKINAHRDEQAIYQAELEARRQADREMRAETHAAKMTGIYAAGGEAISAIVGSMAADIGAAAAGGDITFRQFLGNMVQSLGQYVLQLGASAIIVGGIQSLMGFLPNGPILMGLGAGALAAGAGIIAAGAAMGGTSGGASASTPSAPSASKSSGFARPPEPEPLMLPGRTGSRVINVTFTGPVGGSPRRVARDLQAALEGMG